MKELFKLMAIGVFAFVVTGCVEEAQSNKTSQAAKAKEAANSIVFTENAEIDNIKKRLELTSNPGAVGFVVLMNESGQVIMYTGVKGKITSGGKRLTEPDRIYGSTQGHSVRSAPSDEGTYGSSDPYIYFWTPEGQYIQHNGKYLYSDKPLRLRVEPLVVNVKD